MWKCWSVEKYQHCRLIWKLCIVCEAVLKKAIAEMLTEMVLLFMITLIWKWNYRSKVLPRDYHIQYVYIYTHTYINSVCHVKNAKSWKIWMEETKL